LPTVAVLMTVPLDIVPLLPVLPHAVLIKTTPTNATPIANKDLFIFPASIK